MTYLDAYGAILIDPPWNEHGGGGRGAQEHYPLLGLQDIRRTIFTAACWRPATDCHLWVWATSGHMPAGLGLIEALGFRYTSSAVWVKAKGVDDEGELVLQQGLGQYLRHCHEFLLLGTKGATNLPAPAVRQASAMITARRQHSRKPDEQYRLVEYTSPGPYLEMFARRRSWPNWDYWGNEL